MGKQWKLAPVNGTPDRKLASIDWQELYLSARQLEIGGAQGSWRLVRRDSLKEISVKQIS